MEVLWTKEQEQAIVARDCNLLVAAAAGSGKTAVLIERIIQRVLDLEHGVDIDRLMVVTFTDAAASEMRERLGKGLAKRMETLTPQSDPRLRKRLKNQLTLLNKATISTMHGFCSKFIRKNFNKIELDPNFRVLDGIEATLMQEEVADLLLERQYEGTEKIPGLSMEDFENIVEFYSGNQGDDGLKALILQIYKNSISNPFPKEWRDKQLADFSPENLKKCNGDFRKTKWGRLAEEQLLAEFPSCLDDLDEPERDWDSIQQIAKEYKDCFSKDSAACMADLEQSYYLLSKICILVDTFTDMYQEKKMQKSVLDYNDLEHFALKILTNYPEVAQETRDFYEEVYMDEYQDTNLTQETILSLVTRKSSEKNNLFMVGDVKQSIYGFRQARPDIFLEKYHSYSKEDTAEERLIQLHANFRSRQNVIGSVNYLFEKLMTKEVCGMDYTADEFLVCKAQYDEPSYDTACEIMVTEEQGDGVKREATMIGNRIKELIEEAKGALNYKDIVILLRATQNKADVFQEVLSDMAIPVFCDVNAGFYQSVEGKVILSLLQIIDNPLQDIPLLAVLKSPIGGFTEEEIAQMRLQNKYTHLYYNLKESSKTEFLEKLNGFRDFAAEHDLSELLLEIYAKTDYYNYAGAFEDGKQRQANLQKIYEEAVKYETQTGGGIFEFLSYMKRVKSSDGGDSGATVLGANDNVVRIMSIHKSKGLEFPVVFLANMNKGFNRMDFNGKVQLHQQLGFGMDGFDKEHRVVYETFSKTVMKWKKNQELIAEEIRLLYVAMTRAREKLILCGTFSNVENKLQTYWDATMETQYILNANSYFDMVFPVFLRHPDMSEARNAASIANGITDLRLPENKEEVCTFTFRLMEVDMLTEGNSVKTEVVPKPKEECCDQAIGQAVADRLSATYAYASATDIPAKVSVSQINHKGDFSPAVAKPRFMEGKAKRTAAEWGTITHEVLRYIPLDNICKETIQAICKKQGLTQEEIEYFDWKRIIKFFESDVGKRMLASHCVYRERPFTMEVPAGQLFLQVPKDTKDTVLVQGIIDCYFEEEDGIVILDYKTDHILPGEGKKAAEAYEKQLQLYKQAVETETSKKVKETIIHFLQTGESVIK